MEDTLSKYGSWPLSLPRSLRSLLAHPIGTLARNEHEAFSKLRGIGAPVMLVGDIVSHTLCSLGLTPKLHVVDMQAERRPRSSPPPCPHERTVRILNPPGMISLRAARALLEAASSPCRTRLLVEGEEDLLSLLLVAEAGHGYVVYGQPGRGIVIVDASSDDYRAAAQRVLREMGKN